MRERRKNAEQRRKNLFMTKRLHGIDSRCAACGEITCKSSGHEQHGDHDDEREWIERGDAEQQVSQDERNGNGSIAPRTRPLNTGARPCIMTIERTSRGSAPRTIAVRFRERAELRNNWLRRKCRLPPMFVERLSA